MTDYKIPDRTFTDRKNLTFRLAKMVAVWGYKHLTKPFLELHEDIVRLKKNNAVFFYAPLHKSLWETSGILVPLSLSKLPLPYIGMGDNLIRGGFFRRLCRDVGIFLILRATNRSEMLASAIDLKRQMVEHFAFGKDVLIFPEGTRTSIPKTGKYGKFFPAAFEGLLEYERNKQEYLKENPGLIHHDLYIIPGTTDYSKVREDIEMTEGTKGKPRTLRIWDTIKMIKNIRETYIDFGKPIRVSDHLDKDRKELAEFTRAKCLELVKILPINIVSWAILESVEGECINVSKIEGNISFYIQKLINFKDRFRGFSENDSPSAIFEKVNKYDSLFKLKNIDIRHIKVYRLYANYIGHLFEDIKKD